MPTPVPTIEDIKSAYREGAANAPARYKRKVKRANWHDPASSDNAESLYATKVGEAIAQKARQKGVSKVSNTSWQTAADEKGGARIGPGILAAVDKQAQNVAPFIAVIANVDPPAKTADVATNIANRVGAYALPLHAKKMEMRTTG